jgi:Uma2 family endonuclease
VDTSGLRIFTVNEYDEMLRVGILREGEPVELLGGRIVQKLPKSAEHMAATTRAMHTLSRVLPDGWHVVAENAVVISGYDEPEPDVIVRRGALRDYDHRKATAEDIALLIEVSATSVDTDRGVKLRACAAAGVPVYWIVNLNSRRVEVYTAPRGEEGLDYAHREERDEAARVDVVIDGRVIGQVPVAALLPAPTVG